MESFTEQYFAKCGNCEEIGVREENRNPVNKKRFAKPDLSVKRYAWETTVPDYIINGLDGIHRREVTHKDILSFGQSIDLKVDGILEKRLQKALNLTKKFKTKEENKLRTKMRKKLKKENTKTLKAMKKNQRLENTQILCEEISAAILSLLDMHSSKQRAQTKITERVLQENYAEVWKIVEEEIKKRVETFMETYMSDSEDELHKMLDELEAKFEEEYWDMAEWAVNKVKEMEIEIKDAEKAAEMEGRANAAADAARRAREEAEERRRRAREDAMRRLGLVDSQGNLLSDEFDVEKAMKILEWRREIVDMLHQQLAIAEAERNQVEERLKETCRGFKHLIQTIESEIDADVPGVVRGQGGHIRGDARDYGARLPESQGGTGVVAMKGGNKAAGSGSGADGKSNNNDGGNKSSVGSGAINNGATNKDAAKSLSAVRGSTLARRQGCQHLPRRKSAVHRIFERSLGIVDGPLDANVDDDEFIADVIEKLNRLDDGWHELTGDSAEVDRDDVGKDGGRGGDGEGEGGGKDGEEKKDGDEDESGGKKEDEGRQFCLSVEDRVEYRQHEANQRRILAEERQKERDEEARRKEEEEKRKQAEEPTDEEREIFEAAEALMRGEGGEEGKSAMAGTAAPWVAY